MNILREKLRAQGHHLCQFGGGSSSSSAQTTTQQDNRVTVGNGGINAGTGATVQVLDGGAVQNSLSFANNTVSAAISGMGAATKNATDIVSKANSDSLNFAKTQTTSVLDFATGAENNAFKFALSANETANSQLQKTSDLVKDAYADAKGRGAFTDQILIGAIAMAGLVAFAAVRK